MRKNILLFVACLILLYVINVFMPDYTDNEFPLITDILTLIVFLPAYYFCFTGIVPFLIFRILKKSTISYFFIGVFIISSFLYSINSYFTFISLPIRLFIHLLTSFPVMIFWVVLMNVVTIKKQNLSSKAK